MTGGRVDDGPIAAAPWHERVDELRRAASHRGDGPTLSVITRTEGRRRHGLLEELTCLAAQSCDDFEVVVCVHDATPDDLHAVRILVEGFAVSFRSRVRLVTVTGGFRSRPLNVGVEHALGYYVAFLDDDDVVSTDWIEQFVAGIRAAPTRVVRCASAEKWIEGGLDGSTPYRTVGPLRHPSPLRFEFVHQLSDNQTPICSYAIPRAMFSALGLRFADDLEIGEDWEVLLTAAMVCGVHDTGARASVYHRWTLGESSANTVSEGVWAASTRRIRSRLDAAPLLLPSGSATELARFVARDEQHLPLRRALTDARRRLAQEWRARSYAQHATPRRGERRRDVRRIGSGLWRRARTLGRHLHVGVAPGRA